MIGFLGLESSSFNELSRNLRDDGIAVGAQASHCSGKPMNHAIHLGFRRPSSRPSWLPTVQASTEPDLTARRGGCDPRIVRLSRAVMVGHQPEPLSDLWCAFACSRQIGGPESISRRLQVRANAREPFVAKPARNLFSKEN